MRMFWPHFTDLQLMPVSLVVACSPCITGDSNEGTGSVLFARAQSPMQMVDYQVQGQPISTAVCDTI